MKLATKLILGTVLLLIVVLTLDAYLSIERDTELYRTSMKRDARLVGEALSVAVGEMLSMQGPAAAEELVCGTDAAEQSMDITWIDLNRPPPEILREPGIDNILEELRQGRDVVLDLQGDNSIKTYIPVITDGEPVGALCLSEPLSEIIEHNRATIRSQIILTVALIVLTAVLVLVFGLRLVGRPVHALVNMVRQIGGGDLSVRLTLSGHDELTELGHEINGMCARLEEAQNNLATETAQRIATLEKLRHADRLATVGKLAAGVAHELGTPLNVALGRAQMILSSDVSASETAACSRIICEQVERMTRIIRQLLDFARPSTQKRTAVSAQELVRQVLDILEPMASKRGVELAATASDDLTLNVDREQLQQVVTNLVVNAIQASGKGSVVSVEICRTTAVHPKSALNTAADYACIRVCDQGVGIAADQLSSIFDPFFTTKEVGEGTGLGLSLAQGIVTDHGGWIGVHSELGQGSCFSAFLPVEESDE